MLFEDCKLQNCYIVYLGACLLLNYSQSVCTFVILPEMWETNFYKILVLHVGILNCVERWYETILTHL
jgi:hypothetical protein